MSSPAAARNFLVGDGRDYKIPSEALAAAHDGDTIFIGPGEYFDCLIVSANSIIIQGEDEGQGAVMTDKVCEEKAIIVLRGNDITIRNLTLQRARVPDGNGAGIRLENHNLTVDRVKFKNDQVGILSGMTAGTVTVTDSLFTGGGTPSMYALMIGRSARLRVQDSTFSGVKGGQISTAADDTAIVESRINIGGDVTSNYAVLATSGTLLMERNIITVGPLVPGPGAAIGVWDDGIATMHDNSLINQTGHSIALLKDWSWNDPILQNNLINAGDQLTSSSGVWRHRMSSYYYLRKSQAHDIASQVKQAIKYMIGR